MVIQESTGKRVPGDDADAFWEIFKIISRVFSEWKL